MIKKLVIAGSRNFTDYNFFKEKVNICISRIKEEYELIILSGHCKGVDMMVEKYAKENNLQIEIFPAEWEKYGKSAGPKRNKIMVDNADFAIAFSSGGKGTESLIKFAKQKGIPLKIISIEAKK